jgi:hypothetical protein
MEYQGIKESLDAIRVFQLIGYLAQMFVTLILFCAVFYGIRCGREAIIKKLEDSK